MANPDRAGFRPVRSRVGLTSWDLSLAAPCLIDDAVFSATEASAIAIGTPVVATDTANSLTGKLGHLEYVAHLTDEHSVDSEQLAGGTVEDRIKGVVVGISRIGDMTGFNLDHAFGQFMAGPDDLGVTSKYVTSAEVEADPDGFIVWVADAQDWIFEAQIETAGACRPGLGADISVTDDGTDESVDTTTGLSKAGLALQTADPQFIITHVPFYQDNDPELANARVWVVASPAYTNLGALGAEAVT